MDEIGVKILLHPMVCSLRRSDPHLDLESARRVAMSIIRNASPQSYAALQAALDNDRIAGNTSEVEHD